MSTVTVEVLRIEIDMVRSGYGMNELTPGAIFAASKSIANEHRAHRRTAVGERREERLSYGWGMLPWSSLYLNAFALMPPTTAQAPGARDIERSWLRVAVTLGGLCYLLTQ